jgi:RND superfamily putative drug exporter
MTTTPANFAARMGRWSATHRKKAVLGWLAFVVIAMLAGSSAGMKMMGAADQLTGESATAQRILDRAGIEHPAAESIIVSSTTQTASDPEFRAAIVQAVSAVKRAEHTTNLRSPLDRSGAMLVSEDRHAALVQFDVAGDETESQERVEPILAAVARLQKAHPSLRVGEFGSASFGKAAADSSGKDFQQAEVLAIPVTILILLVAFGAFAAALLPVGLALTAFIGASGLVMGVSHAFPIDHSTFSVMLLIGLAVGVDYSMFYIRREREERAAGKSAEAALEAAAATSGRTILVSGLTVMVAVAGMFFTGAGGFRGIATGTILVVATSMLASITVLPAMLSKLGDRIEKGRIRFLPGMRRDPRGGRFWNAIIGGVLRRPKIATAASAAFLIALAIPAFSMHTVQPGTKDFPQTMAIVKNQQAIERAFPGGPMPAQVVVEADSVRTADAAEKFRLFRDLAVATGQMQDPITVQRVTGEVATISVPLAGDGTDATSTEALDQLRHGIIPATLARIDGVHTVAVGGQTAWSKDYDDTLRSHAPLVFLFVLALAFLLLLVTFRSIVIPIKAIVLNLLSVGAAYGFLVAMFQWGWGEKLLGFESTGGITAWVPLFLFVVLFGLSMDYHVFVISRIREAVDKGMRTDEAVGHGIRSTAGVVTSAAMVMVVVFAIFGSLTQVSMKQVGIGLAVAILLDATVIRAVLLPATMKLLGEWNWWLPRPLHRLPQIAVEPAPEPSRS